MYPCGRESIMLRNSGMPDKIMDLETQMKAVCQYLSAQTPAEPSQRSIHISTSLRIYLKGIIVLLKCNFDTMQTGDANNYRCIALG